MATDKQVSFLRHLLRKAGDSAIDTDKLKEMDTDEASELIDELLDTADAQAADNMATDKQVSFLRHLLQKAGDSAIDTGKLKELDKDEASALIDELSDTADVLDAGGWTPLHFAARNNEVLKEQRGLGGFGPSQDRSRSECTGRKRPDAFALRSV